MSWYNCWVCDQKHPDDEFPTCRGVPITWGGMGWDCLRVFNTFPPDKQKRIREDGIARFEARQRAKANA